jgi:hypothetical protein
MMYFSFFRRSLSEPRREIDGICLLLYLKTTVIVRNRIKKNAQLQDDPKVGRTTI